MSTTKRPIKFRAWLPAIQTMLYDIALYPDGNIGITEEAFIKQLNPVYEWRGEEITSKLSEDGETGGEWAMVALTGDEYLWFDDSQFELMQYAGNLGKDEAEVWEGDIVETHRNYHGKPVEPSFQSFIRYNEYVGTWQIAYGNIFSEFVSDNIGFSYFLKVVGNIHQSPSLTKKS